MSLKIRLVLSLLVVVVLYTLVEHQTQRLVVQRTFEDLEEVEARRNLDRVVEAVSKEAEHLAGLCRDWSVWDDTYRFVQDSNADFLKSNLNEQAYTTSKMCLVYILDLEGRVVWSGRQAPAEGELAPIPELPTERWPLDHTLLIGRDPKAEFKGLLFTAEGPMLVAATPILDSLSAQPSRGTLVMGRRLDEAMIARIREQTRLAFELTHVVDGRVSGLAQAASDRLITTPGSIEWQLSEREREGFAVLRDVHGTPVLAVHATLDRDISARGQFAARMALGATLIGTLLLLTALYFLLQSSVVLPLARLTAQAVRVGERDELTLSVSQHRNDEIGILSREFESMMRKLAASRAELMDASRNAGKAEVATSVIHNVGNLLNRVTVSSSMMRKQIDGLPIENLKRLTTVIEQQGPNVAAWIESDPRGKQVPRFLVELTNTLREQRQELQSEAGGLAEALENVRSLIRQQQSTAAHADLAESFELRACIDKAVAASKLSTAGSDGIDLVVEGSVTEPLTTYRHRLHNVLINLLNNAQEAVASHERKDKRVTVRCSSPAHGRVAIEVEDNGTGVPREDRLRIFNFGVTTKPDGHGFGLHASANDAHVMGGSLKLDTERVAPGARFVIEFPANAPKSAAQKAA